MEDLPLGKDGKNPGGSAILPPSNQDLSNRASPGLSEGGYSYRRVLFLSLQAILNAILIGFIAKILVDLIHLVTNLSFYGRFSLGDTDPGTGHLGWLTILVPVAGGLIVGFMARYGSSGIRGHGIPEAMEQVLVNDSRISPIITFLKPLSSAIAIGTGGPFGAEGPIIATGGAFGSLTGQLMRISAHERKIMLTAGSCAGMAAIFGSPMAAVLMAVELLLFEFSPKAIIPLTLSACTGAAIHILLFGSAPMFGMALLPVPSSTAIIVYSLLGLLIGVAAAFVSRSVYYVEDLFDKLPVHWMWWPALGAFSVGVAGYFVPRVMGVGYDNISLLLTGNLPLSLLFSLCFLKFLAWVISLGSGTSGGTLAPLFIIGGGLGALLGLLTRYLFPACPINMATASLIGMAALFAGASRALLTSIVFALETTGQLHGLLPLIGACTSSYFVSFFLMKGSIMTMKIERRGIRVPDKFEPDLFTQILAGDIMSPGTPDWLYASSSIRDCRDLIRKRDPSVAGSSFLVLNEAKFLLGIVPAADILLTRIPDTQTLQSLIGGTPYFIYPKTPLNEAIALMDEHGTGKLPVLSEAPPHSVLGELCYQHILAAYHRNRDEGKPYLRVISLKRKGQKAWVRGKRFFQHNKREKPL